MLGHIHIPPFVPRENVQTGGDFEAVFADTVCIYAGGLCE